MAVEMVEANELGLWVLDHDQVGKSIEDADLWIPWRAIESISGYSASKMHSPDE
jgi:hypothetical protein